MQPITDTVKALFTSRQKQLIRITGVDAVGVPINITEADVAAGGFRIDRYVCTGSTLEVGTAVAAEMTLKLNNFTGKFDDIVFEGAEMYVEIGIADWTQASPTVYWMPCGYFTSDIQPRSQEYIMITALDRMTRFDQYATGEALTLGSSSTSQIVDESENEIAVALGISFPVTLSNLVRKICDRCQVPFTQSLGSFPNYGYSVSGLPASDDAYTWRNVIQWCAGLMGANAYIDQDGKLRFAFYSSSFVYTAWAENRYSGDIYENAVKVTGIQWFLPPPENSKKAVLFGDGTGCVLDFTNNRLLDASDIEKYATALEMLGNVHTARTGYTFYPFTASVDNVPYIWPMDCIKYVKKNMKNYTTVLTNVNFTINGCTQLQAIGETDQERTRV